MNNNLKTISIAFAIVVTSALAISLIFWRNSNVPDFSGSASDGQFLAPNINSPGTYNQPLIIKSANEVFSIAPLSAQPAQAQTEQNVAKYINAFVNTDIVQTRYTNKIKEDIILKQPGHPAIFEYQIDLTPYDFSKDSAGNFIFYQKGHKDDNAFWRFAIPAPFLIDANGRQSSTKEVVIDLRSNGRLTLKPSAKWLSAAKYPVVLDPTIEINVLNVHSHPQQGQNWTVDFTTQGTADLKIIPNDQATIDDDEFVSLSCGSERRQPQILAGDIIFYPNWSCSGTGEVIFYTKKAGNHTLRFDFGGQIAYAYNSASSQTFSYTGSQQTWQVPAGVTSISADVSGAGTASGGGRVQATLSVTPEDTLYIYVGGTNSGWHGGWNGGADGGGSGGYHPGGGGGGASDIRQGGTALANRIIIGGGGGGTGAGGQYNGGAGGYSSGVAGAGGGAGTGGGGGTQSAGGTGGVNSHGYPSDNGANGSLGSGGVGGNGLTGGGGGGGGYYGGGGGCGTEDYSDPSSGAGGGSSWTNGSSVTYTTGYQSGNGQIIISWRPPTPPIIFRSGSKGTLTIQPSAADNTLDNYYPNTNFGSSVALDIGTSPAEIGRSVMSMDFASLPAGAVISSAIQYLYYYTKAGNDPVGRTDWAYRLTQAGWTELGSTWNKYDGTNVWTTAGGDYTSTNGASTVVPASYGWMAWDVTAQVQYAQANTGKIAYFLFKGETEEVTQYYSSFHSNNYTTDPTLRPKLVITYTVPAAPTVPIIFRSAATDQYTKLLIHADEANGSTAFIDSESIPKTITAYGNASTTSSQGKFGNSASFDGTGDYLSLADSADWDFGTGDFAIDFWLYPTVGSADQHLIGQYSQKASAPFDSTMWNVIRRSDNKIYFRDQGGINELTSTNAVSNSTWTHVAVVRNSGTITIYLDGVANGSGAFAQSLSSTNAVYIGQNVAGGSAWNYTGYLDELRISKGLARWTTNFTPPTAPYSSTGSTVIFK